MQDAVAKRKVVVDKVPGKANPADLMTKYLSLDEIVVRVSLMGVRMELV